MRSPKSLRRLHRLEATVAVVGTVAAVFGVSRIIRARAEPPPVASAPMTDAPPPIAPPIIPRTLPPVQAPPVEIGETEELVEAASQGDIARMEAAFEPSMHLPSAMLAAAEHHHANAVAWLLDHGAEADDPGVVLAADASPAVLKVLFDHGANEVTLSAAARAGAIHAVNRIFAKGGAAADPNAVGDDGTTPFTHAVDGGNVEVVRAMLAHGARVDETHLDAAMTEDERGAMPVLDALLSARVPASAIAHALEGATGDTGAKLVKKLAAKGIAWSSRDAAGDEHAPLVEAVERQDVAVVRAMLESGAPVNQAGDFGKTPLGAALSTGLGTDDGVRIVRLLLQRGADPNRRLGTGERPLARAAAAGDLRVVTLLLDHGASIDAGLAATDDETALEAAENAEATDVARVLRARGARRRVSAGRGPTDR